jgi:hypothetical protein
MENTEIDKREGIRKKKSPVTKINDVGDTVVLSYDQLHLKTFLLEHPAISVLQIESICGLPKDTLRHFLKERRNIPAKYFDTVSDELMKYGFVPMRTE